MAVKAEAVSFLLAGMKDSTGNTLTGGKVYFYSPGTTTPKSIYLNRNKSAFAANPYTLDAAGRAEIFADGVYDVAIKTSAGASVTTFEGISFDDPDDNPYFEASGYPTLQAAIASIGATPGTLRISTDVLASSVITVPSTLGVKVVGNGKITNGGAATITFNGPFEAELKHVFVGFAAGDIAFGIQSAATVHPEWWAAIAGIDDSAAVQRAFSTERPVEFQPNVTYVVGDVEIKSNPDIYGHGWTTILKQKSGSAYGLSINSGTQGTTSTADNMKDVRIRDMQILGTVATDGFEEHTYLLNINAASDITVERVKFVGPRGDAIYIGSSNVAGVERHNQRIVVRDSYFDGLIKDNRNGISVIDCDGIEISNSYFTNLTKAGMPGAIDIEPNNHAYHVVKNVNIRNNIIENNGGAGITVIARQAVMATPMVGVEITGNTVHTTPIGIDVYDASSRGTATIAPLNLNVSKNNLLNISTNPLSVKDVRGFSIDKNYIYASGKAVLFMEADASDGRVFDGSFTRNILRNTPGLRIGNNTNLSIDENVFDDIQIDNGGDGIGISLETSTGTKTRITNNDFRTGSVFTYATKVGVGYTQSATDRAYGNKWGSLLWEFSGVSDSLNGTVTLTQNSATPSVKGSTQFATNNTIGTSITDFTGGYEGQEITVVFGDAQTTIVHGGNFRLSGSVNFAFIPTNTVMKFIKRTVWREVSRMTP